MKLRLDFIEDITLVRAKSGEWHYDCFNPTRPTELRIRGEMIRAGYRAAVQSTTFYDRARKTKKLRGM